MKKLFAWRKHLIASTILLGVAIGITVVADNYELLDYDQDRGAIVVGKDAFGDSFSSVRYLDQGWKPNDSLWFYNITQGSDLVPYDFFLVLEQLGSTELFRSNENINNRYRYLPQKATRSNPDGLPVGLVKDDYKGKEYMGFTCAACHTGQVNYNGIGIRIDGGQSGADMESFIRDLAVALYAASDSKSGVHKRFVKNVLALGHYKSEQDVDDDLQKYVWRIKMYYMINHSDTHYGYARLDAFGRIYNRVLEHLVNGNVLRQALSELVADKKMTQAEFDAILGDQYVANVLNGNERDHIVERVSQVLNIKQQIELRDQLFNTPNAPVSYPFLWDIPQHDYVQWNGLAANAGVGPIGRNTGEVIGVFGTLDWTEKPGITLSSLIGGQGLGSRHISFESSVNVHNLRRIEHQLSSLKSPLWTDAPLPALDMERVQRGEHIFDQHCVACHAEITRDDPNRRVVAHMSGVKDVGTDPAMARNSVNYMGQSGILRNQYVNTGVGNILLDERTPVAALLTKADINVVATPDPDKWLWRRGFDWAYDLVIAFVSNDIKPSIKRGNYNPDTTVSPYASLMSYKGRSLNGIWATAPFLHNGSVPSLYDLLLPKKSDKDPAEGEYRPDIFQVGSREFDPVKVGLKSSGYKGFMFDTSIEGNSNSGHEYGARELVLPDGKVEPALTKQERLDLLEYLKSL